MPRNHIVITGTGRAGTSFIMQLLTRLGLETGFTSRDFTLDKNARAGLEILLKNENCPYIVKDTWLSRYIDDILKNPDIEIEHIFIPMRDLHAAAESRRFVQRQALQDLPLLERIKVYLNLKLVPGGVWPSHKKVTQEDLLLKRFYKLVLELSRSMIPVTLIQYPKLTTDCKYLYAKLSPVLKDIDFVNFSAVFNNTVNKDWVHSFGKNDK